MILFQPCVNLSLAPQANLRILWTNVFFKDYYCDTLILKQQLIQSIKPYNECKLNLSIYAYIGEDFDRHISFNIDEEDVNGFDIWMDIDIYQAELLGKKILQLVENRKQYLEAKFNKDE